MLAVIKENKEVEFVIREVPKPVPKTNDVLIKVKAVGICGSDMPIFAGISKWPLPLIPGHEFAGVIEEVGSGVKDFEVGDRVTAGLVINCGECIYCRQGLESLCENIVETGIHVDGAFAEYVTVPAKTLHRMPETMTFDQGASIDPIASAYRPVKKANIGSEDSVVVFGPGPIGIYTVQCAKAEGAKRVICIGTKEDTKRLEIAKSLGADHIIELGDFDITEAIREANEGLLPDIVFEASGHHSAVQMCLNSVRKHGQVIFIGLQHHDLQINLFDAFREEAILKGSLCYTWKEFKECIDLVNSGRVKVEPLITHTFPLKDIGKGLELLKKREALKVVLHP